MAGSPRDRHDPASSRQAELKARLKPSDIGQRYALPIVWGISCLIFASSSTARAPFRRPSNFSTIFGTQAVLVVLTLGLLIPLTAGDYDLSVAYVLTLSSMVVAILNVNDGWSIDLAILAALGVGVAVGFVNGGLVSSSASIRSSSRSARERSSAASCSGSATPRRSAASRRMLVNPVVADRFLGIPLEFYYGLALSACSFGTCSSTRRSGDVCSVVGRGRSVSRLSGIRVAASGGARSSDPGIVSAGAGVLYAGTTGAADPTSGISFLLPAYAAAFLGATAITPGLFNPWGRSSPCTSSRPASWGSS